MKRIVVLFFAMLLGLAISGCTERQPQDADVMELSPSGGQAAQDATAVPAEEPAIIFGRVEKIVGNEVTLALGEPVRDARSERADDGEGEFAQGGQAPAAGSQTPAAGGELPERPSGRTRPDGVTSGRIPSDGGMPSGGGMPEGATGDSAQGSPAGGARNIELAYTGETATYLLPVGMSIGTGDFSNVSEGMVLSITLDAEGAITEVSILSR